MKTRLVLLAAVFALAACQAPDGTTRANLIGTLDLVLADELAGDQLAGRYVDPEAGTTSLTGLPSRFLFVTSADTNELRVLENFVTGRGRRAFLQAPNPLETLSIPVLDRPTMLAIDEGRNAQGDRVTGSYVYAARPGGAEISVVSVTQGRQLGGRPMVAPGPVTAIAAHMDVDASRPVLETPRPATTRLYVATWDGSAAAIFAAELATDLSELKTLDFQRVVLLGATPIAAILVVEPVASRTSDGAPFCNASACLAIATRPGGGKEGRSFLIDPQSGRLAYLPFSGPVKQLVSSGAVARIYGVLDEQTCGAPPCGGVVAVDLTTATTSITAPFETSFPPSRDALGLPWRPLRSSDGLITGLTVASGVTINQTTEAASTDGGVSSYGSPGPQQYNELGAIASSTGVITFFSGLAGSIIDFDARRSTISSASLRLPGPLPDGGLGFSLEDGGVSGSNTIFTSTIAGADLEQPWRTGAVTTWDTTWKWDVSDGYLQTQGIAFVYQGQIPGLVNLPTTATDGVRLTTGGYEVRALVGDVVVFQTAGALECGRSRIATVGTGFIEATEVPAGCEGRALFSVRADGAKPLVVAADAEGYMGRWGFGETLTYSRPYVLLTANVIASRTALKVEIPERDAFPPAQLFEGVFTTFQVLGHMLPYEVSLDTVNLQGCYTQLTGQVVMGNLVMAEIPSSVLNSADIDFRWTVFGVVPSGNSVIEIPLKYAARGAVTPAQGAYCWR